MFHLRVFIQISNTLIESVSALSQIEIEPQNILPLISLESNELTLQTLKIISHSCLCICNSNLLSMLMYIVQNDDETLKKEFEICVSAISSTVEYSQLDYQLFLAIIFSQIKKQSDFSSIQKQKWFNLLEHIPKEFICLALENFDSDDTSAKITLLRQNLNFLFLFLEIVECASSKLVFNALKCLKISWMKLVESEASKTKNILANISDFTQKVFISFYHY